VPRHAKTTKLMRDSEMIKGLRKHRQWIAQGLAPDLGSVEAIIGRFQEHLDAMVDAARREIAWRAALEREEKLEKGIKKLMGRVKPMIESLFDRSDSTLRDFGIKPFVRRKPSIATMKVAVEKRRETRALRRTMGRKQKRKIKAS
jgi:hypothetical protein